MPAAPAIPDTPNPLTPVAVARGASSLEIAPAAWQIAHRLAGTEFVPTALRDKPEAVLACIMSGHELGIGPMQALQKIHVIEGRPALSAELMRALVMAQGHEIWFDAMSSTTVTIIGRRRDQTRETKVTWTMDDAKRAGLSDRKNWRSYPMAMLMARATGTLCRAMFADTLAGFSYTVEELSDGDQADIDDIVAGRHVADGTAPPAPTGTPIQGRKRTRSTPTTTAAPPAAAAPAPPLPGEDESDIIDAEIVEPAPAPDDTQRPPESSETDPPPPSGTETTDDFPPDPEPPVDTGRPMDPKQALIMRFGDMGITDRDIRLTMASEMVGRPVTSFNELDLDDIRRCFAVLNDESDDEEGATDTVDDVTPPEADGTPPQDPVPAPGRRGADPTTMTGDQWRDVLKRRGVKAAEALAKARELAGAPVGTLDDIAASGVGQDLLDFIEDLALSRGK